MDDALIISDLHLGSLNCQAKQLGRFLEAMPGRARRLVLNGDVFDSRDFRRLKRHHWHVLSELRRMSDHVDVVWLRGNHDGQADQVSCLLGLEVADEAWVESAGKRLLCLHGDVFDSWISNRPWVTHLGDCVYHAFQWIDNSHRVARWLKRRCKSYLRNSEVVKRRALEYMSHRGADLVTCGHTHAAEVSGRYSNSGCWTEAGACTYLAVRDGEVRLEQWG